MSACVIDASAVLAFLFNETGAEVAEDWMDRGAAISTANVQEVLAKLVDKAIQKGEAIEDAHRAAVENLDSLVLDVVDLTMEDAMLAAAFVPFQKTGNLSAGDRCCLALGRRLKLPTVHAEQKWQPLADQLGVELVLIRDPEGTH